MFINKWSRLNFHTFFTCPVKETKNKKGNKTLHTYKSFGVKKDNANNFTAIIR